VTASPETYDDFLMGRVKLLQPARGYRAGIDPVLLAAATPAEAGQTVLELGCGAGAASLCLNARVSGLSFVGVEMQALYADLARRNAVNNGAKMEIFQADIQAMPLDVRDRRFDHVIANPPYYLKEKFTASNDAGRNVAVSGETPLETWIDLASKRLGPRGYFTMIQKADRLLDILAGLRGRLGSVRVRPIQARADREARLVIVQARKLGRGDFVLEAPLRMHDGPRHERDGDSYSEKALAILRHSAVLSWGG
jgi:tRNA1(Val) A37 N6-methylase TrmN6